MFQLFQYGKHCDTQRRHSFSLQSNQCRSSTDFILNRDTLTLMLLAHTLTNTKRCKQPETLAHGYLYESACSERCPMNTNMTGFRWFHISLCPCALYVGSFHIGRVKQGHTNHQDAINNSKLHSSRKRVVTK